MDSGQRPEEEDAADERETEAGTEKRKRQNAMVGMVGPPKRDGRAGRLSQLCSTILVGRKC